MRSHALARPGRTPPGGPRAWAVSGRLVHADGVALHHARVEVFLGIGVREDFLTRGVADGRGRFTIPFHLPARMGGATLRLRVLAWRPPQAIDEPAAACWRVAARVLSPPLHEPGVVDVGVVPVHGWALRAPGRVAPLPPELRDGDGQPLVDRPPAEALAARLAAAPLPPPVAFDPSALMRPHDQPASARCAALALGGALLDVERRAVAAFRHLRRSPLTALLLPRLRGACWLSAAAEHMVRSGAVDLGGPSQVFAAADAAVGARLDGAGWQAVRDAAQGAFSREVEAWWHAHADALDGDVVELRAMGDELGHPGWRAPETDPGRIRAWVVDTLVLALVQLPWQRHQLATAAAAGLASELGPHASRALRTLPDSAPVAPVDGVERALQVAQAACPEGVWLASSVLP